MAHHTHLVQTGLAVEQNKTGKKFNHRSRGWHAKSNVLSIPQMSLNDPTVLKKRVRSFVVTQVYTFTSITDNISGARVGGWAITDKLLEIRDVMWRY
jgi:hypothetical protein